MDLTNTCRGCIFASWFFHNSIRFKVNKVWLGDVGRHPLIVYRRFYPQGPILQLPASFHFTKKHYICNVKEIHNLHDKGLTLNENEV